MRHRLVAVLCTVVAVAISGATWAHEGHAHKVMGTVSAVHDKHFEVKTTDGKTVIIALDEKTVYQHGKAKVDVKMLKVGERVVVAAVEAEGTKALTAKTVQMAAAPAAAKK